MKSKKNIKQILVGAFAVFAVAIIGSAGLVSAFQGDPTNQGPNFDPDMHDLMTEAFNSADYAVWKDLMEESDHNGRVLEVINEENFNEFVKAHNAAADGDFETANAIRAELGLNNGEGPRDGTGFRGQGKRLNQNRNEIRNDAGFIDDNGDGVCDNQKMGNQMKGMGKGRNLE